METLAPFYCTIKDASICSAAGALAFDALKAIKTNTALQQPDPDFTVLAPDGINPTPVISVRDKTLHSTNTLARQGKLWLQALLPLLTTSGFAGKDIITLLPRERGLDHAALDSWQLDLSLKLDTAPFTFHFIHPEMLHEHIKELVNSPYLLGSVASFVCKDQLAALAQTRHLLTQAHQYGITPGEAASFIHCHPEGDYSMSCEQTITPQAITPYHCVLADISSDSEHIHAWHEWCQAMQFDPDHVEMIEPNKTLGFLGNVNWISFAALSFTRMQFHYPSQSRILSCLLEDNLFIEFTRRSIQ